MDSPDNIEYDIDTEFAAWLAKEAAEHDEPTDPYGAELEVIKRFQRNPNPDDFEWLYNVHRPLIGGAARRYTGSSTLPKAALNCEAMQHYAKALQTYDPDRGASFKTWLYRGMQRLGRYNAKYSNVARITSEDRGGLIEPMQSVHPELKERLGREPTVDELHDEMRLFAQDVDDVQKRQKLLKDITPKNIRTLLKEMRSDYTAEQPGPTGSEGETEGYSHIRRQAVFLHGSLGPEQQLVLEHSFEGFGKPVSQDDNEIAQWTGLSPQKVRAIKGQIGRKIKSSM